MNFFWHSSANTRFISILFSPRRTLSPDSVEFLEEIPPPSPRSYFRIQESDSFESLVRFTFNFRGLLHLFPRRLLRSALIILIQMTSSMELSANLLILIFRYLFRISPLFSSGGIFFQPFFFFLRYYSWNRLNKICVLCLLWTLILWWFNSTNMHKNYIIVK